MIVKKYYPMKSDVRENKDAYLLEVDLPGCKKENIKAYIEDGHLYIAASFNQEKTQGTGKFLQRECYCGDFQRSFYLGSDLDQENLKANFKDGVLTLEIPKLQLVTRKIEIEG